MDLRDYSLSAWSTSVPSTKLDRLFKSQTQFTAFKAPHLHRHVRRCCRANAQAMGGVGACARAPAAAGGRAHAHMRHGRARL